jgi:hypothetical protein
MAARRSSEEVRARGPARSQLGEDRPRGADAGRERVGVALNDVVKLLGESGGFFVGQVKVRHGLDMGSRGYPAKAERW